MICEARKDGKWLPRIADSCNVGPYSYGKNIYRNTSYWIGYDDEESAEQKGSYVTNMRLGGVSFWALELDDYKGVCNGTKFPAIKATKRGLQSSKFICPHLKELLF